MKLRSTNDPVIELGRRYKDRVSGFEGVAVARTEWLFGCERVTLQFAKDGEIKQESFDAPALVETGGNVFAEEKKPEPALRRTGGPRPEPRRPSA